MCILSRRENLLSQIHTYICIHTKHTWAKLKAKKHERMSPSCMHTASLRCLWTNLISREVQSEDEVLLGFMLPHLYPVIPEKLTKGWVYHGPKNQEVLYIPSRKNNRKFLPPGIMGWYVHVKLSPPMQSSHDSVWHTIECSVTVSCCYDYF